MSTVGLFQKPHADDVGRKKSIHTDSTCLWEAQLFWAQIDFCRLNQSEKLRTPLSATH